MSELSSNKQKIIILLLSGLALDFTYTSRGQIKILKETAREWKLINQRKLNEEIRKLYGSKLVDFKENSDKSSTLVLTKKGKLKALNFHFEKMKIRRDNWDGKWRIVIFDIPEKLRRGRDALRDKLKKLGFYELQKSVFVFPYKCEDELDFIIEFFDLRKYVRYGTLDFIDNELHLEKIFKLL